MDKLCYIHINRRILDAKKPNWTLIKQRLDQLTEEEEVEFENILIEQENTAELF